MIKAEDMTDAVMCREDDCVLEVSRILRDTQRRSLVVLDKENKPVGIISAVDVNNRVVAEEKEPRKVTAAEVMTKGIRTVSADDSYEKAVMIMAELGTYSIPVVRNFRLTGLLEFKTALRKLGGKK